MKHDPDLAERVAALEERLREAKQRHGLGWLAGTIIVIMLTVNLMMVWRAVSDQAAGRLEHQFWVVSQPGATSPERLEAFTALVRAGNREWRSARLKRLPMQGADLAGTNLENIDLEGCDLTDTNMESAKLRHANLELVKLIRVNLSQADLSESYLRKVDLTDADVRRANLRSISLEQSEMVNTNFERADMAEASLLLGILTNANLTRANLSWSNLDAADLTGADLSDANLEGASLRDTFFGDSNWWRARGLPAELIERFKEEFPPGEDASDALKEDFVRWLKGE